MEISNFYRIRIVINNIEKEKLYQTVSDDTFLREFIIEYNNNKYSEMVNDQMVIKISESDSLKQSEFFIVPNAQLGTIRNGFSLRALQYELNFNEIVTPTPASSSGKNAFEMLMNRSARLIPPRNIKKYSGPNLVWNKIVDWIEADSTARFKNEEEEAMMTLMYTLFNALWYCNYFFCLETI